MEKYKRLAVIFFQAVFHGKDYLAIVDENLLLSADIEDNKIELRQIKT